MSTTAGIAVRIAGGALFTLLGAGFTAITVHLALTGDPTIGAFYGVIAVISYLFALAHAEAAAELDTLLAPARERYAATLRECPRCRELEDRP